MTHRAGIDEPDWYLDHVDRIGLCDLSILQLKGVAPRTKSFRPPSIWRYTTTICAETQPESPDFGAAIEYCRVSYGGLDGLDGRFPHTTRIRIRSPLEHRWRPFRKGRAVKDYYREDGMPRSLLAMFYADQSGDPAARNYAIRQLRNEGLHDLVPGPQEWTEAARNEQKFSAIFSKWKSEALKDDATLRQARTALARAKEVVASRPPHDATLTVMTDGSYQRTNPNFDQDRWGVYLALKTASYRCKGAPTRESVEDAYNSLSSMVLERERRKRIAAKLSLEAQKSIPPLKDLGDFNKKLKASGFAWLPREPDLSSLKRFRL